MSCPVKYIQAAGLAAHPNNNMGGTCTCSCSSNREFGRINLVAKIHCSLYRHFRRFATMCYHLQPFSTHCDHLRLFPTICDYLRQYTTTCDISDQFRLFATICECGQNISFAMLFLLVVFFQCWAGIFIAAPTLAERWLNAVCCVTIASKMCVH